LPLPKATQAGERLDRYELIAELASGGMAMVFLARLEGAAGFQRLYALKVLHPHLAHDAEFVDMFLDEARLAARIRHPNVVPILEVGESDRGYYLVMEYIEGDTASRLIARATEEKSRLPASTAARIAVDALAGLHAAHELKADDGRPLRIVHRDVSPQNILVGVEGVSRITDFGVAHAATRLSVSRTGQLKGKLAYMSPEQARGVQVDRRADVWAMGVVLWEMLVGGRLFRGENDAETLQRILFAPVPGLRASGVELPEPFEAVCMRALERDPDVRYASAADFGDALELVARQTSMLDTHRQLAAYVDRAIGVELTRRRTIFSAWLSSSEPTRTKRVAGRTTQRGFPANVRENEPTVAAPSPESSGKPVRRDAGRTPTGRSHITPAVQRELTPPPRSREESKPRSREDSRVRAPLSDAEKKEGARDVTPSQPRRTLKVLTVDPSPTARSLVRVHLMGMNFQFLEATRADQALELLVANPIDLVICEAKLPGADGLSLLRDVRASLNFTVRQVPFVFLTAERAPGLSARATAAGASRVVVKPLTSDLLLDIVTKLLKVPARAL
jgi:eukaryotic-like serine/threonine-protein kinase